MKKISGKKGFDLGIYLGLRIFLTILGFQFQQSIKMIKISTKLSVFFPKYLKPSSKYNPDDISPEKR
jgi:hypothetical protein